MKPKTAKRNDKISIEFLGGKTIKEIGHIFNLTSESVRQILKRHFHTDYEKIVEQRKKILKQSKEKELKEQIQIINSRAKETGRIPTKREIKEEFGFFILGKHYFKQLKKKGYKTKFQNKKYSKEILLKKLKDIALRINRTPSTNDINKYSDVFGSTYRQYFGSLTNAQKLAGLKLNRSGNQPKYDNADDDNDTMLKKLKDLAVRLKKTPTSKDFKRYNVYSRNAYISRFGSVVNAQKLVGLKPNKRGKRTKYDNADDDNDTMLQKLSDLAVRLKKTPSGKDLMKNNVYSRNAYISRFGSVPNAQKLAGLKPNKRGKRPKYDNADDDNDTMLQKLSDLAVRLKKTPSGNDLMKNNVYSRTAYVSRFGLLSNAQKLAGLKPNKQKFGKSG